MWHREGAGGGGRQHDTACSAPLTQLLSCHRQGPDGLRQTKIADFGLAKSLTGSVVAQSVVGTMPYTCPEIIQQERYTEKADVWSLGCVLYHILMLKPPFDGTNPLSVASRIVEGSYEPVSDPPGGVAYSMPLKQLVKAMMTVNPDM